MDLTSKVDVLDLIISVLRDHEKNLDEAISRLEKVANRLEKSVQAREDVKTRHL